MSTPVKVLVADDEALVRQGLVALLESEHRTFTEVADGEQAWRALQSDHFDVALIDIGLPLRSGLDVLQEVIKREVATRVIILTGDTARHSPRSIYESGAAGFLYKTADADQMSEMFDAVLAGSDVSALLQADASSSESRATALEQLTERERQIVKLVVEGNSNKKAAEILSISEHTVRKHREHINTKLKAGTPAALAALAIRAGLV